MKSGSWNSFPLASYKLVCLTAGISESMDDKDVEEGDCLGDSIGEGAIEGETEEERESAV